MLPAIAIACIGLAGGAAVAAEPAKPAGPQVVTPTRTIPVGTVIAAGDVALKPVPLRPAADVLQSLAAVVGKEAQRSLYPDRPIRQLEIGAITLVERNARVILRFRQGAIVLTTVGRALEQGGMGQIIRVMNLDSRRTIYGRIAGPETVDVGS